jgi:hypothetical protein
MELNYFSYPRGYDMISNKTYSYPFSTGSGPVSYVQKYDRETASYYRQRPDILIVGTSTDCVGLVSYTTILSKRTGVWS